MNVKERIQKYLDYMGIKSATFEREVGLSNGYWKKTKNISADNLAAILRRYSDLSINYVVKGVEPMLCPCNKDSDPNAPFMLGEPEPTPPEPNLRNHIDFLEQQLKLEQEKNKLLQQQLNLYENKV